MGHVVTYYKSFGLTFEPDNLMALCHFWRVVGYMIGIDDRFNLCNSDSLEVITSRCNAIFKHIITPGLMNRENDFEMMSDAFFNGLLGVSSEFEPEKFTFISKRLSLVPGFYLNETERKLEEEYMEQYPHYTPNAEQISREMLEHPKQCKSFSALSWFNRWDILFTDFLVVDLAPKFPPMRIGFNFVNDVRMFFLKNFPVRAIWKFGWNKAWVSVLKE